MPGTKQFNFTDSYEELEKIVAEFESREIDLEKDLPRFERGLQLASQLQKRLKQIENKVVEIEKKFAPEAGDADEEQE
jgi:exodeoxyribonuclease VII small subunit